METITNLIKDTPIPKMVKVRQNFDKTCIPESDIPGIITRELDRPEIGGKIQPGQKIAITCGSRGINHNAVMARAIVDFVKSKGAESIHHQSPAIMHELVEEYGRTILENAPVLGGIAIIENAYDDTYLIKGLSPEEIISEEPKLKEISYKTIAHLLFDKCDVLVVDKIGKNISGDGMDPNVSGRFVQPKYCSGGIQAEKCVILDLTDETHGNAQGIGLAEVTTRRLFNKMKLEMTYPTGVTNTFLHLMKIPMIMDNDREAM